MSIAQNGTSLGVATGAARPAISAAYTPRSVLQAAAAARRTAIDGSVADALASDRFKPDQMVQDMARGQVQALLQRVQILKKLYAGNPREMARVLAQLFKELKAAVKAYQQATGDELGMAGDLASGALNATAQATAATPPPAGQGGGGQATPSPATQGDTAAGAEPPQDAAQSETSESEPAAAAQPAAASDVASTYAAVTQGVREGFGRDAQSFFSDVRDVARVLSDILTSARIQAKAAKPDKATAKAFEDADKQYASLQQALDDADRDLRNAVPTLGLRLSIAA